MIEYNIPLFSRLDASNLVNFVIIYLKFYMTITIIKNAHYNLLAEDYNAFC